MGGYLPPVWNPLRPCPRRQVFVLRTIVDMHGQVFGTKIAVEQNRFAYILNVDR